MADFSRMLFATVFLCLCFSISTAIIISALGPRNVLTGPGAAMLFNIIEDMLARVPRFSSYYSGVELAQHRAVIEGVAISIRIWVLNTFQCSTNPNWSLRVPFEQLDQYASELFPVLRDRTIEGGFASMIGTNRYIAIQLNQVNYGTQGIDSNNGSLLLSASAGHAYTAGSLPSSDSNNKNGTFLPSPPRTVVNDDHAGDCQPAYNTLIGSVGDPFQSGAYMIYDHHLLSANDWYMLSMQSDCNLVLYNGHGEPIWSSDTYNKGEGCYITLQKDGNLALYDNAGHPHFATGTNRAYDDDTMSFATSLQDDGNFVLYQYRPFDGTTHVEAIWASNTVGK